MKFGQMNLRRDYCGKWVYLLTEMGNNIIQYGIQEDNKLKELSKVTLLPEKC